MMHPILSVRSRRIRRVRPQQSRTEAFRAPRTAAGEGCSPDNSPLLYFPVTRGYSRECEGNPFPSPPGPLHRPSEQLL